MAERIKLTPHQIAILDTLDEFGGDFGFLSFDTISANSGVPRKNIRRIVRWMARKGWTKFASGLSTEDGDFAGSGYCITDKGRDVLSTLTREGA